MGGTLASEYIMGVGEAHPPLFFILYYLFFLISYFKLQFAKKSTNRNQRKDVCSMAKKVIVVPYNKQWRNDFEIIKQYLLTAVETQVIGIEHVGSTSVEGLSAKPIIDIDIVIKDYSVFDKIIESLSTLGYIHEGNLGIEDREAFDYRGNADLPIHHLYVCPEFSLEIHRHISFRDYLRNNPEAVLKYSKVKEEGARLFPNSIDDYIAYKSPFIEEIYKEVNLLLKLLQYRREGACSFR